MAKAKNSEVSDDASQDSNQIDAEAAKPAEGEVLVTATVPKAFKLRIDNHVIVDYKPGVQEMPLSHAEHWYSKANGVQVYNPK